ncbi:hypothetical protein [Viridibacillus arvi]|uniref:Uncharacterized protein n=1 Tax=Viridibacillus arvi TaxID=263475 RepID=A0A0M0LCE5_9BACL|nr:hypothetical protein [Viridibacillus arvi]KOO48686.1 hypothetical protein AMD00_09590 [Viridibacillus arvi]
MKKEKLMKIDAIIQLLLFIMIPTFLMRRSLMKMSEEDRKRFVGELTKKSVLSTYGLIALSILLLMIGRIVDIVFLKIISGLLFSIGVIVHSVLIWFHVSSKYKALLSNTLGIIGLIIFLWSLWKIY